MLKSVDPTLSSLCSQTIVTTSYNMFYFVAQLSYDCVTNVSCSPGWTELRQGKSESLVKNTAPKATRLLWTMNRPTGAPKLTLIQ